MKVICQAIPSMTLLVPFLFKIIQTKAVFPGQWFEDLLFFFSLDWGTKTCVLLGLLCRNYEQSPADEK